MEGSIFDPLNNTSNLNQLSADIIRLENVLTSPDRLQRNTSANAQTFEQHGAGSSFETVEG